MRGEYEKITKQLESLIGHCGSMKGSEDADPIWEEDMRALQEAIDIIANYEKMSPQYGEMTVHFKIPQKPVSRSGVWCCPACGKRVHYHHTHCHWCGKKMGWGK